MFSQALMGNCPIFNHLLSQLVPHSVTSKSHEYIILMQNTNVGSAGTFAQSWDFNGKAVDFMLNLD